LKLEPTREAEIVEELAQHLDDRYSELLASGATDDEAARAALVELSESETLRRELRHVEPAVTQEAVVIGSNRRSNMLADLWQDLRYAARMLLKQPGFTLIAILTLALGIGANTAVFSVVDAVLLKPLPVTAPAELVLFKWNSGPKRLARSVQGIRTDTATGLSISTSFSYTAFEQFQAQNHTLTDVFAFAPFWQLNVNVDGEAEIASGQLVSGGYYRGLGISTIAGRRIEDEDDRASSSPVAVVSHQYWQRRFGGDQAVIGKVITVNGLTLTIIGVTPREFSGTLDVGTTPDFSIPLALDPQLRISDSSNLHEPWTWWLKVMGRVKPGVTKEQVRGDLEVVFQQSALEGWQAMPAERRSSGGEGPRDVPSLKVLDGSQGLTEVRESYAQPLKIMMGIVGLVLLIVCANLANLFLARAERRRKEIAVRLALGASRFRLIRQLLTESFLLALMGGVVGWLFSLWTKDLLLRWNPWRPGGTEVDLRLDWRVFGFAAAVSLFTGMLFGLMPAWQATRVELQSALKENTGGASGSRPLLGKSLVVAQVAVSIALLVGAGLFVRTLRNLHQVDLGFNRANLLLFRVDPRLNNYQGEQIANLYERMIESISALPGVRAATMSRHPLLSGSSASGQIFIAGQPPRSGDENFVWVHRVRANFFETMEISLVAGRDLSPHDDRRAPKVAVVSQSLVKKFFPHENPIGKHFGFGAPEHSNELEIVGVVGDTEYTSLRQQHPPTVYVSYLQEGISQMNFEVRTVDDPIAMIPAIRAVVREVDANLPLFDVTTQNAQAEESVASERLFAQLSSFFALLSLALASIGLYGVMAYGVAQRTREMGIRVALGAQAGDVLRLVIGQGMKMVLLGMFIGLPASLALTRLVKSLLFGVSATDPLTFAVIAVLLISVAVVACYVPARRATKVDPMVALRYE
jgi:predicted permease